MGQKTKVKTLKRGINLLESIFGNVFLDMLPKAQTTITMKWMT